MQIKQKKFWYFLLLFLSVMEVAFAGGGRTHMFIASEVINLLPDAKLQQILSANKDAYLVGAYYPDAGYVAPAHFGEDSHWDPFIYAFADYLKEKYPEPAITNPKLLAFLFGCAVHRLSDEIIHWTFYPVAAKKDLHSDNWETFHTDGDVGIDLLITVDKNLWLNHPSSWWVPVNDLIEIYHRMGKYEYTKDEIIWGNSVIAFADYSENLIALPAYPILKLKLPWASAHYYDWPVGGILMDERKTAEYLMNLWRYLNGSAKLGVSPAFKKIPIHKHETAMTQFAEEALHKGLVSIKSVKESDGSILFKPPLIHFSFHLNQAITQFLNKHIK